MGNTGFGGEWKAYGKGMGFIHTRGDVPNSGKQHLVAAERGRADRPEPDMQERVVVAFDPGPEAMADFIAWRRSGRRLLRVTGAGQDRLAGLQAIATVHSGRRGIAPDLAPAGVLEILGTNDLPPRGCRRRQW